MCFNMTIQDEPKTLQHFRDKWKKEIQQQKFTFNPCHPKGASTQGSDSNKESSYSRIGRLFHIHLVILQYNIYI